MYGETCSSKERIEYCSTLQYSFFSEEKEFYGAADRKKVGGRTENAEDGGKRKWKKFV